MRGRIRHVLMLLIPVKHTEEEEENGSIGLCKYMKGDAKQERVSKSFMRLSDTHRLLHMLKSRVQICTDVMCEIKKLLDMCFTRCRISFHIVNNSAYCIVIFVFKVL